MVQSILVLGAGAKYDFEDEKSRRLQGRKLHYVVREITAKGEAEGYFPISQSVPLEVAKKVTEIPGIYNAVFEARTNKDGRLELRLKDVDADSATPVDL